MVKDEYIVIFIEDDCYEEKFSFVFVFLFSWMNVIFKIGSE